MSLLPTIGAVDQDTGFYNGVAKTSYRNKSTAFLSNEADAPTSAKIMSFGGWIKRHKIAVHSSLFSGVISGSGHVSAFYFNSSDQLNVYSYTGSAYTFEYITTRLFRDTSAWYHLWVEINSTQATNAIADRVKIYVNGIRETSFGTETRIADGSPDIRGYATDGAVFTFGHADAAATSNAYYADWYFIDGSAVSPVDTVGEFKGGVFIPKAYSPTFGDNGFHLKFDQIGIGTASDTTIGADSSDNDRHFASTDGTDVVASDCALPDSPENNFATMNPLHFRVSNGTQTYSDGNLKFGQPTANSWGFGFTTLNVKSGKWYAELRSAGNTSVNAGVANVGHYGYHKFVSKQNPQNETGIWQLNMDGTATKTRFNNSTASATYTGFGNGQILGILLNADDKELSFTVDGTLQTGFGSSGVVDISTDGSASDAWSFFANTYYGSSETMTWNFGQDSSFLGTETATSNADAKGNGTFHTAPPSGYLALCTANLEEPTIGPNSDTTSSQNFAPVIYNGLNSTAQDITVGFKPDFVWIKTRNAAISHMLFDSNRGATKFIQADATGAEGTGSDSLTDFDVSGGGFSLGADSSTTAVNNNGKTYVSFNWKANGSTTTTNDASSTGVGDIDSVYQANTTAGFSIVTYTSNNSNSTTVAHGLGIKPDIVIQKNRSATSNWLVLHQLVDGSVDYHLLDSTSAGGAGSQPASTTSTIATWKSSGSDTTGNLMVAYCFASIEGYSKMGIYTGNGNANGAFVYTEFRPAWLMVKFASNASESWHIFDSTRATSNVVKARLIADGSSAENSNDSILDFTSNGFKFRENNAGWNGSGNIYIYMAFAEAPFKYANAR